VGSKEHRSGRSQAWVHKVQIGSSLEINNCKKLGGREGDGTLGGRLEDEDDLRAPKGPIIGPDKRKPTRLPSWLNNWKGGTFKGINDTKIVFVPSQEHAKKALFKQQGDD